MNLEYHLQQCGKHLTGPDGGRRDKDSVDQVLGDVRRIAKAVNSLNNCRIFEEKVIRDEYLQGFCIRNIGSGGKEKFLSAAAIRKYLKSYLDFISYIITERVDVPDFSPDDILTLKLKVSKWRKSYVNDEKSQQLKKNIETYDNLVSKESLAVYEESQNATRAKQLLGDSSIGKRRLSQKDYVVVRDHLISLVHFSTASRSGVTANLMMEEFESAKMLNDGRYLIRVNNHKTRHTYGPASVTLKEQHFLWLTTFVKQIRTQLPNQDNNVFLAWSGRAMKSGAISGRLHDIWVKAGIFDDDSSKRLCANVIRKSASTSLREKGSEFQQEAADTMAHSLQTADKNYFVRKFEKSAAKGSEVISNVFYGSPSKEDVKSPIKSTPKKKWNHEEIETIKSNFDIETVTQKDVQNSPIRINATPKQVRFY